MNGTVAAIFTAGAVQPMMPIDEAVAVTGHGLRGDRYHLEGGTVRVGDQVEPDARAAWPSRSRPELRRAVGADQRDLGGIGAGTGVAAAPEHGRVEPRRSDRGQKRRFW